MFTLRLSSVDATDMTGDGDRRADFTRAANFVQEWGPVIAIVGIAITALGPLSSRLDDLATEVRELRAASPSKEDFSSELRAAAAEQKADLQRFANEQREITRRAETQIAVLDTKVAALDQRIQSIGVDRSYDLQMYFENIRRQSKGNAGGPEGDDDLLQDYAVRLVLKLKSPITVAAARKFVDRAFARPRGPEATELVELARAANESGKGAD